MSATLSRWCGVAGCRDPADARIRHPRGVRVVCEAHAAGHPILDHLDAGSDGAAGGVR